MWIVRLALRRPYTFVVASILILILGVVSIVRTPVDIFPNIDIPVINVAWQYTGLSPQEISDRVIYNYERSLTTTVNDIEHIESTSLNGIGLVKIFFHPHTNMGSAIAQVTAISQSTVRNLPPGITPPFILTYNASSVPILQLGLSGAGVSEQQLADMGQNFVRTALITVPGIAVPYPYGGKQRTIMVDLNPAELQAKGLSPLDVVNAVDAQNLILPAGTAKIGAYEYQVDMNGSPLTVEGLNDLPIKTVNGSTIYIKDVGDVRDGFTPQTNIVRVNGQRASLMSILKLGDASTLDVINGVRQMLPQIEATLPVHLNIDALSDQSIFVKASISGVVREGAIAACLTALMILVFLGSWRSTLIIAVSIPLSVLTSLIVLSALGETINIMTLGGLALAVGILVDDATVEVENINRNLDQGKEIIQAILDGASQIAVPALVSTLSICIVFVPMFFLSGVAKYLFVPLAEAVVFAMMASYLLSRTLVPTMARYLLARADGRGTPRADPEIAKSAGPHAGEIRGRVREVPRAVPRAAGRRDPPSQGFRDCLPLGLRALVRARASRGARTFSPASTAANSYSIFALPPERASRTWRRCATGSKPISGRKSRLRNLRPILDNIGLPYSTINLSYSTSAPIGPADADIQVELAPKHHPTIKYVRDLRVKLAHDFPGVTFYELPVDIVTQILEFRLAGADRCQDRGAQPRGQPRLRGAVAEPAEVHSRHGRPENPAALQLSEIAYRCGPHEGEPGRVHAGARSLRTC